MHGLGACTCMQGWSFSIRRLTASRATLFAVPCMKLTASTQQVATCRLGHTGSARPHQRRSGLAPAPAVAVVTNWGPHLQHCPCSTPCALRSTQSTSVSRQRHVLQRGAEMNQILLLIFFSLVVVCPRHTSHSCSHLHTFSAGRRSGDLHGSDRVAQPLLCKPIFQIYTYHNVTTSEHNSEHNISSPLGLSMHTYQAACTAREVGADRLTVSWTVQRSLSAQWYFSLLSVGTLQMQSNSQIQEAR